MLYKRGILFLSVCFVYGCSQSNLLSRHPGDPATIKLMAFGGIPGTGGQPSPGDLRQNWAVVHQLPIQALNLNLTNRRGYFVDEAMNAETAYNYDDLRADVALMQSYEFTSDMQLFVRINISALLQSDWFDDTAWEVILNNIAIASRAAAKIGAIGFCLDNEQYNYQPFNFTSQAQRVAISFGEYQAQTRQRGRQFARALTAHLSAPVFIFTFGNSHIARENWKKQDLHLYHMGLWPAFIDGMMDGAARAEFIDGHEDYSAETFADFRELRRLIKEEGPRYSADPARYQRRIRAAFSFWLKATDGIEMDLDTRDFSQNRHSPEAFEHALHYAMLNSDGWVWLYAVPWLTLPAEYLTAVEAARKPHRLDFDFTAGQPVATAPKSPPDQLGLTISAKHRLDHDDATVFKAMLQVYQEICDFPKQWEFRFDPDDVGLKEKWFSTYPPNDWIDIRIDDWYGHQLDSVYTGMVWYRTTFEMPANWVGRKLLLAFGAVDEQAWIWINERPAGQSTAGPSAWNSAFEIDVSHHVRPGSNELCVRVYNKVGPGGIWKSVKLFSD